MLCFYFFYFFFPSDPTANISFTATVEYGPLQLSWTKNRDGDDLPIGSMVLSWLAERCIEILVSFVSK